MPSFAILLGAAIALAASALAMQAEPEGSSPDSPSFVLCGGADGSSCSDSNPCTVGETCQAGYCAPLATFAQPAGSPVTVGSGPRAIVTGDWNGDGTLDLAVANRTPGTVSILLGTGGGAYIPAGAPVTVGTSPVALAVGDWNRNGTRDLAVANSGSSNVTILLGNGAGTFTASSTLGVGAGPASVAAGDLNGDGVPDLVVANQSASSVSIFLGNGAGGFNPALGSPQFINLTPSFVALGDFDSDGTLDFAVASQFWDVIDVVLGDGSGGIVFNPMGSPPVGMDPSSIAVADLNRDGWLDLAVTNVASNDVTVLLGNGVGGFAQAAGSPIAVGAQPRSVIARDLNRDGILDLAVASFNRNTVSILLGNGSGKFGTPAVISLGAGTGATAVVGSDLDEDGKQDLAAVNATAGNVAILLNNTNFAADGTNCDDANSCTLTSVCTSGLCTGATPAAEGAGCNDSICAPGESCHVGRCLQSVTFGSPGSTLGVGTGPRSVVSGDWNSDGTLDLAVANRTGNTVTILLGNGSGGFSTAGSPSGGLGPIALAVGDWNGDGTSDLAAADSNAGADKVWILIGTGSGGFIAITPVAVGTVPVSVVTGDWNGDGTLDLATANQNSASVTVLLGTGSGGFNPAPGSPVGAGTTPVSVVAGDWNGDGVLDLAVANNLVSGNVTILLGIGGGGFVQPVGSPVSVGSGPFSIAAGDLNGDGALDLAVAHFANSNNVSILLGNGSGKFTAVGSPYTAGMQPRSIIARDLNWDGRLDLVVASFNSNDVSVLLGNGSGGFASAVSFAVAAGGGPSSVVVGDWNGDGKLDLATANTTLNNASILLNTTSTPTDGVTCNDGNACTQTSTCHSGVCSGANPVACTALDQCHVAGTCSPQAGRCTDPVKPNGTACADGVACTESDSCNAGVCAGSPNSALCNDGNPCTSDACDALGCSYVAAAPGGACSDGNACTTGETCSRPCSGTFAENFDGVTAPALPAGWTTTLVTGLAGDIAWRTAALGDSLPNGANTDDPNHVTDKVLVAPMLPAGATQLSFRNSFDLESAGGVCYDGGVLEIRIGSGAFQDILAAGGSFLTGGYTGPVSTGFSSPIAGRQAWCGNSSGFITTNVTLPPAAVGQSVTLRWRVATDSSAARTGMTIDTITVTTCASVCSGGGPVGSPGEVTGDHFAADKRSFSWTQVPFATRYDFIRGDLSAFPVGPGGGDEICVPNIPSGGFINDSTVPAPAHGFFYLVRGENTCGPPPGTYGTQSNGTPRISTTCP